MFKRILEKALDKWLAKQSWDDEVKAFVRMLILDYFEEKL